MPETWVQSLGREDSLEKGMATHSSILAWRIPWTEEPGRLQSMGWQTIRHAWVRLSLSHQGPLPSHLLHPPSQFPFPTSAPLLHLGADSPATTSAFLWTECHSFPRPQMPVAVLKPLKLRAVKKIYKLSFKNYKPKNVYFINSNKLNANHLNAFFKKLSNAPAAWVFGGLICWCSKPVLSLHTREAGRYHLAVPAQCSHPPWPAP